LTSAIKVGIEQAIRLSACEDFVLIIDDDVVVKPDYLRQLVSLEQKISMSIIGSVVVDDDKPNTTCFGGREINWITAIGTYPNEGKIISEFAKGYFRRSAYLTGRRTLFPSGVFCSIGLYDA